MSGQDKRAFGDSRASFSVSRLSRI